LELKIIILKNDQSIIPRISQLSQKTNQFNLTAKRYTEGDIENFINDPSSTVYGFSVSDKFGDSGVTGLSIVTVNQTTETAEIDSFLMSCRVIGRNVEYAFLDYIIQKMKGEKIRVLNAKYNKVQKNEQVKEFYDKCSFILTKATDSVRHYNLDINNYEPNRINYIEIVDEK